MIPNEVYCVNCLEWSETGCTKGFVDINDCCYMDKQKMEYSEELYDKCNEEDYEEYIDEPVFDDDVGEEE